jgi:hypothetical protein
MTRGSAPSTRVSACGIPPLRGVGAKPPRRKKVIPLPLGEGVRGRGYTDENCATSLVIQAKLEPKTIPYAVAAADLAISEISSASARTLQASPRDAIAGSAILAPRK